MARGQPPGVRGLAPLLDRMAWAACLLLIASIPIEDSFMYGPLSLSRLSAIAAFVPAAINAVERRRLLVDRPVLLVLLGFLAWVDVGLFWTYDAGLTRTYLLTMTQLILLVLIIWQNVTTPQRWRTALVAASVGGLVGSILSLLDSVSAHGGTPRYSIGDPNDFGISMAIVLVMTVYLAVTSNWWGRAAFSVIAVLDVIAISRTASRTAAIAVILSVAIMLFTRRNLRPGRLIALAALAAGAVVGVRSLTTDAAIGRIQGTVTALNGGDLDNRTYIWQLAWRYWTQQPLGGIGGGTFRDRSAIDGGGKVVHSVFIGLLVETGAVGLALFLVLAGVVCARVLPSGGQSVARYLLAVCVVWLCGALTLTLETRKVTWLLVSLFTSVGAQRIFEKRQGEPLVVDSEHATEVSVPRRFRPALSGDDGLGSQP
jgi:O-antigen ligase